MSQASQVYGTDKSRTFVAEGRIMGGEWGQVLLSPSPQLPWVVRKPKHRPFVALLELWEKEWFLPQDIAKALFSHSVYFLERSIHLFTHLTFRNSCNYYYFKYNTFLKFHTCLWIHIYIYWHIFQSLFFPRYWFFFLCKAWLMGLFSLATRDPWAGFVGLLGQFLRIALHIFYELWKPHQRSW